MKNDLLKLWGATLGILILVVIGFYFVSYSTAYFEGIGSITLLILGILAVWKFGSDIVSNISPFLVFFIVWIFLGLMFDAAGNFIYNKPFQMLCPTETMVVRDAVYEEDHDGDWRTNQYFSCYSMTQGKAVKDLPRYVTMGIRAFEYLIIGFVLLGIYWSLAKIGILKK